MKPIASLRQALFIVLIPLSTWGCSDFNLFSIEDDKQLGMQLRDEILANPSEYHVIPRTEMPDAYAYIDQIRDKILNAGMVTHKDDFAWEIYLIDDDQTLNAFCAPGGYIFVYSGLIKYLDSEDELAGVMGHEIAHADKRHSTEQMTKIYGINLLVELALGDNQNQLSDIAQGLVGLEFSRSNERQADELSVQYLCGTDYNADASAEFFEKLNAEGQGTGIFTFLSTHPDPGNRVNDIRDKKIELNCSGSATYDAEYEAFKAMF